MKTIHLIFFDAGGGHRSAANALKHVISQQGREWQVEMVNLQELFDSLDVFRKLTGVTRMADHAVVYRKNEGAPVVKAFVQALRGRAISG